jgi:site-specific recombinase XerD
MARRTRSGKLEGRGARLSLPIAKKPVFVRIGPGVGLGYRRNRTAGTWTVRVADGAGGNWIKVIAHADDFENANGNDILDFWQAQDRARAVARAGSNEGEGDATPATVAVAMRLYEADLRLRGAGAGNARRLGGHITDAFGSKYVAMLTSRDLRRWRDMVAKKVVPATVNRTCAALKAALNLAADNDERITNRQAWETGLAAIPDAEESRNVVLPEESVRKLIVHAFEQSAAFGLLLETAAVTGARVSQLARLEAQDVQADRADPRLMMPSSRKGRGQRKILRRPVPIPVGFAARLKELAAGKSATDLLLLKPSGQPWKNADHLRSFRRTAKAAGLDPTEVTMYALRHSNIVRQILAGVPIRVVAVNHDTSIAMLERTYSRHIGDFADALTRKGLLDISVHPLEGNVVRLGEVR